MNKQELIDKYEAAECVVDFVSGKTLLKNIRRDLEQLDEPQPVKVPQFVADWIEYCKVRKITLAHALYRSEEAKNKSVYRWIFESLDHQETFALAWIFGYKIEGKRYLVKVKGMNRINGCLANNKKLGTWYFGISGNSNNHRTHHTRKKLEEAGFGWVFDCPGIEIEEVTD